MCLLCAAVRRCSFASVYLIKYGVTDVVDGSECGEGKSSVFFQPACLSVLLEA